MRSYVKRENQKVGEGIFEYNLNFEADAVAENGEGSTMFLRK